MADDETSNFLEMSDEEIANIDPSTLENDDNSEQTESDSATAEADSESEQETTQEQDDETGSEDDTESDDADEEGESDDTGSDDEDSDDEADEEFESDSEAEKESEEESQTDYKAEYEKIMAPFRANGKEMSVKSADEVRQLMQMGANYNKKMASLKPNLKMMKTLENNGLLDEEQINYLVDLKKGDSTAIQKLVKDSGVDPLEFEEGKEKDYQPNTYTADDTEVELDSVLEELKESPKYSETLDIVSNKWDSQSRQTIAENPHILRTINEHVENGTFQVVADEMERQKTFGGLKGLSDIEAYKQIGEAIQERGGFNSGSTFDKGTNGNTGQSNKQEVARKKVKSKTESDDPKRKEKKRAAGSTKSSKTSKASQEDYNPLAMSDEEFEKAFNKNLM